MAEDPLKLAAESLEKAAKQLIDLPEMFKAAQAQGPMQAAVEQLNTLHSEMVLGMRADLEARQEATQARQEAAVAQSRAAHAATPLGQAQAKQVAEQKQDRSTFDLRAETSRMRAEAQHFATPLGQAQLQSQHSAVLANQQAAVALARAKGTVPSAFQDALEGTVSGLMAFKQGLSQAEGVLLGLTAKASPAHAETYQGSWDLLMAKIGSHLLPVMEASARSIQNVANRIPDPNSGAGKQIENALSYAYRAAPVSWLGVGADPLRHSLAGLPQAQMSTGEAYADRLQMAALNTDDLQTDLLRVQVKNLERIVGLLEETRARGEPPVMPFR